jgi:hypothetical protein
MKKPWNLPRAAARAAVCALLLTGASLADEAPLAATHTPAAWQKHQYSFAFLGFTSTYSCDGLADKLMKLLLAAGARADVKSVPGACAAGFGRPDKFARADLTFYTLAPIANEAGSVGQAIDGIWRSVTFANRSPRELLIGDCELVEQFRDQVLKKMFATRNLVSQTTCVPYQESGSIIDLRFDSLVAAPQVGAASPIAPGAIAPAAAYPEGQQQIFMYPKNGQSEAQQALDKRECQTWASAQAGGASGPGYRRAMLACLDGRGYSVN